jgi:hypothetical protein
VASGGGKVDITKVGLNSIEDEVVKQNLMGRSRYMGKKDWVDAQGRKGKVGCSTCDPIHRRGPSSREALVNEQLGGFHQSFMTPLQKRAEEHVQRRQNEEPLVDDWEWEIWGSCA